MSRTLGTSKWLSLMLAGLALAGCGRRSLSGDAFYCACSVPPFGRGGCGSGPGIPFDSWTCVPPGASAVNECNRACQQEAGAASGVFLRCTDLGGIPMDEPILHPEPSFAGRCASPSAGPLLASTGHESSAWAYVAARSNVSIHNARDSRTIPLSSGMISLYMPEGHRGAGPMRFDMLSLVGVAGLSMPFDGHVISDFRLLNSGPFVGEAGPGFVTPPRPGQINSYTIKPGKPLSYTVMVDGYEISDLTSNTNSLEGYIYAVPSSSLYGGLDYYFVYEGAFTLGDADPVTLDVHLEFKYGGPVDRPEPPVLGVNFKFDGDEATPWVVPTPAASVKFPRITYRFTWVKGKEVGEKAAVLSTSDQPTFNAQKLGEDWVTVIVQAEEAGVFRTLPVCLLPLGCKN